MKAMLLFFCIAFVTVTGCESMDIRDYPKEYVYNLSQEKEGITVELKDVSAYMNMNDQLTVVRYSITNNRANPIQIINDEKKDMIYKTGEMITHYFQDEKGNKYRLRGYSTIGPVKEEEGNPTQNFKIEIPSQTKQVHLQIDYDAFDIKSFEWRVVVTLETGETIPFTFNGDLNEEHLKNN